jgi:hypothetical protein
MSATAAEASFAKSTFAGIRLYIAVPLLRAMCALDRLVAGELECLLLPLFLQE